METAPLCRPSTTAGSRPQFSLRALFGVTTWIGSVVGLAVSHLAGWTMFAVGFSLACFNSAGWLAFCQKPRAQTRLFRVSWLLLVVSLFLPAVQGCGTSSYPGWYAAVVSFQLPFPPLLGENVTNWYGYALHCLLALANLLLVLSPLLLWRLRLGKGQWYGAMFVTVASAMWCFSVSDTEKLLVGYYVWCLAGIAILCTFPMRWAMLPLLALAPLLVLFAG